jgi:hypothetical protein
MQAIAAAIQQFVHSVLAQWIPESFFYLNQSSPIAVMCINRFLFELLPSTSLNSSFILMFSFDVTSRNKSDPEYMRPDSILKGQKYFHSRPRPNQLWGRLPAMYGRDPFTEAKAAAASGTEFKGSVTSTPIGFVA